ncbi:MAG: AAA family ATPase [Oligoflexia bacterium]|nr:AAA family ATPase [Oligoflexia bacterium]
MSKQIIGRIKEIHKLNAILNSSQSELVAIYGRRRVGKTFLIRKTFDDNPKLFYFEVSGEKEGTFYDQLENFRKNCEKYFKIDVPIKEFANWKEAFATFTKLLLKMPVSKKIVIFFDELPWLATPKSKILQSLDYYWNNEWSKIDRLKLIICGSAASWMLKKIIHAKGGLHNRLTQKIHLTPFSLDESKKYLSSSKINIENIEILKLYLSVGGIPYYLSLMDKGKSAVEIIQALLFAKEGPLFDEFDILFKSLYTESEIHVKILLTVAKSRYGISRSMLLEETSSSSGGGINDKIEELVAADFIEKFIPYGRTKKDYYLRLADEFIYFYIKWIKNKKEAIKKTPDYWFNIFNSSSYESWAGYAFENLCIKNVELIIKKLKLESLVKEVGSWRYCSERTYEKQKKTQFKKSTSNKGAQIDLLIERKDNVIILFEIKFTNSKFTISKAYYQELTNKIDVFKRETNCKKQIFLAMITWWGLNHNQYSQEIVSFDLTAEEIFFS